MKTALIAGSTGLVGSALLNYLIENSEYEKIHLLLRKPVNSGSPKVVEHIIDFDQLKSFHSPGKIDHVFCTLGTTIKTAKTKENFKKVDFGYVLALGKKALEWKAEKFLLVSALGASPQSRIFYNRVKGEAEKALNELGLAHLYIFRPSLLMGNRKEQRTGEKAAIAVYKVINPLFVGRLKKYKGIDSNKVALAICQTALKNNASIKIFESDEIQHF